MNTGETVTCTFTHTARGTLTVTKVIEGEPQLPDPTAFGFDLLLDGSPYTADEPDGHYTFEADGSNELVLPPGRTDDAVEPVVAGYDTTYAGRLCRHRSAARRDRRLHGHQLEARYPHHRPRRRARPRPELPLRR